MERRKEWGVLLEKAAKNKIKKDGTTETGYKSHPSKKYKNLPKTNLERGDGGCALSLVFESQQKVRSVVLRQEELHLEIAVAVRHGPARMCLRVEAREREGR